MQDWLRKIFDDDDLSEIFLIPVMAFVVVMVLAGFWPLLVC